ncbi:hypothetical protein O181_075071 [Austropuccinia psidii MF-1]|uniref:Uncharacterized protein n=1 Tax=Austropuccinia psidii MF-1 TaxID=1389203 RepID=A0A9Q3FDZ5_9BASI|nr:hypothetical protein [Austropuccinia psidii MF-1]
MPTATPPQQLTNTPNILVQTADQHISSADQCTSNHYLNQDFFPKNQHHSRLSFLFKLSPFLLFILSFSFLFLNPYILFYFFSLSFNAFVTVDPDCS